MKSSYLSLVPESPLFETGPPNDRDRKDSFLWVGRMERESGGSERTKGCPSETNL